MTEFLKPSFGAWPHGVSILLVTMVRAETLNGSILGVTFLLGGETKVAHNVAPLSERKLARNFRYTNKVDTPIRLKIMVYMYT